MLHKKILLIMAILVCMVNIADAHGGRHGRYYKARCGYHHKGRFRARHYGSERYKLVQAWVQKVGEQLKKEGKKVTPNELKKKIIKDPEFQKAWEALIKKKCPDYKFDKDNFEKNFGRRRWGRGRWRGEKKPGEPGKERGRRGYGKGKGSSKGGEGRKGRKGRR